MNLFDVRYYNSSLTRMVTQASMLSLSIAWWRLPRHHPSGRLRQAWMKERSPVIVSHKILSLALWNKCEAKKSKTKHHAVDSSSEVGAPDSRTEDLPSKSTISVKQELLMLDTILGIIDTPHDAGGSEMIFVDAAGQMGNEKDIGPMSPASPAGPVVNIIHAMPHSSLVKPSAWSKGFLNVPQADAQASSEMPSTTSSISETTTEKLYHYASRGVWKSCLKMVLELCSSMIKTLNVQMLFEVTVLTTYIKHKGILPQTVGIQDVGQSWCCRQSPGPMGQILTVLMFVQVIHNKVYSLQWLPVMSYMWMYGTYKNLRMTLSGECWKIKTSWMEEGIPYHSLHLCLGSHEFLSCGLIMSSIEVLHNFQGPPHHSTLVSDWLKKAFGIAQPTQHFIWCEPKSGCSLSSQISDICTPEPRSRLILAPSTYFGERYPWSE